MKRQALGTLVALTIAGYLLAWPSEPAIALTSRPAEPNAPAWQPAPVIDKTRSSFHKDNPHGLPFSFYETLADGTPPAWQPKPVIDKTPSSFHKDNPHGLPFSFYEQYSE